MRVPLSRFITICLILSLLAISTNEVKAQKSPLITGTVQDENGKPLPNVSIIILNENGTIVSRTKTNSQGKFNLILNKEGAYSIYALLDKSSTKGVDYVPSLRKTYLHAGSTASFNFILKKGATILFEGDARFIETGKAANYYRFTVTCLNASLSENLVTIYGNGTDLAKILGFNERLVVIPADIKVIITAFVQDTQDNLSDAFTIKGKVGYFKLSQGKMLHVDIREYSLKSNLEKLTQILDSSFLLLKDAEDAGFLVTVESRDLSDAYNLLSSSLVSMRKELYDETFAKIRNAYLLTHNTMNYLQGLFQMSSRLVLILPFFFIFLASAIAYLITEKENYIEILMRGRKKFTISINLLVTLILYILIFTLFYLLYPGSRIASKAPLMVMAFIALALWRVAAIILPRILSERKGESRSIQFKSAIIIAFSLACRNLRKRRLRTILNLINIIVLIFGLITFTSIAPGYGLVTQILNPAISIDALLIRSVPPFKSGLSFFSLPQSFITWLKNQPNVSLISLKAENIPLERPIGILHTKDGKEITVEGVIGVTVCNETRFTRIHRIVVGGSYLQPVSYTHLTLPTN